MKDLLNVLYDHYNAQLPLGTVMPYGWTIVEVNYAVEVNDDGELTGIYALGATSDADEVEDKAKTKAKGKDTPYQKFTVPVRRTRTSGAYPYLFCDAAHYMFGTPKRDGKGKVSTIDYYGAMKNAVLGLREYLGESPALCAIYKFYETWDNTKAEENPYIVASNVANGGQCMFFYNGKRNPACYVKESLSMQIKLYGNGHSCNIPVQEIIDKYWKDETAPFSFEMSTAIGDETIAATAMLGEESPDTYPSIRLDSRNARKNSSATWFILETPNETNPYVTGYAYAGNDETESDSWITKIVDAPRGADDDSKRLVYIDDDIAETVDTKTASKLNTKYGNHCADYCATSDQLFGGKFDYEKFGKRLAANDKDIEFVEGMIVSKNENVINHVADILDALGFTATTGYYDPAEDKKANISDKLTGYYYCDM